MTTADWNKKKTQKVLNRQVMKDLKESQVELDKTIRVLLLGAGESGKSTFVKQMAVINENAFCLDDRKSYTAIVRKNVFVSCHQLIKGAEEVGESIQCKTEAELVLKLTSNMGEDMADISNVPALDAETTKAIETLWKDAGVQAALKKSNKFQLLDSTAFFLDALSRIAADDYVPTNEDVLKARTRTVGVIETKISLGDNHLVYVDVAGQRGERKKWLHNFSEVTAVQFVVSLSGYNLLMAEDNKTNRMMDALETFEDIVNNDLLKGIPVLLVFNKKDLCEQKLGTYPLKDFFPQYSGDNSVEDVARFFASMFLEKVKNPSTLVYHYTTTATSTKNVEFCFSSIKDILLASILQKSRPGMT